MAEVNDYRIDTFAQSSAQQERVVVTTRDVARLAGVSSSTVSHVLNGTRFVSDDVRRRVLGAVQNLGYEPNGVARSLKVNRSMTIGLIISDISNPFFTAVVRGVEDVTQANGYVLVLCNSDEDTAKEAMYLRALRAKRLDGLILAPAGEAHDYLRDTVRAQFPLVFLNRDVASIDAPAVLLDNEGAAFEATNHLIDLGHRRIGMIGGRPLASTSIERKSGFARALRAAGLPADERLVVSGGSEAEGGHAAALALLSLEPRPTAIFSGNNLMTIGALAAIQERGLSVPQDVALLGFDDFSWAGVFRPRLSTVAQPTYELGCTAANVLLKVMAHGSSQVPRRTLLPGRLVIRESCGAAIRQDSLR
jgi:LacI family transcriptional regulator, galactose operon repressor